MVRDVQVNWQVVLLLAADRPGNDPAGPSACASATPGCSTCSADTFWLTRRRLRGHVLTVSTPIKIWNNARIEHRLQEQEKLLLAAKVEALKSQINPHFLFNTLTSVSSLIRSQPETARTVIQKLSGLLRKLMRSQEQFVTLREELDAIDEYLDIEVIRFGPRLAVTKSIAADTLDVIVPSMLLQPLVENCNQARRSRARSAPAHITIRSRRDARPSRSSTSKTTGSGFRTSGCRSRCRAASASATSTSGCGCSTATAGRFALTAARPARAPARASRSRSTVADAKDDCHEHSDASLTAVVADDEQLARDELCFLLGQIEGVEVVGQAANGARGARRNRPSRPRSSPSSTCRCRG